MSQQYFIYLLTAQPCSGKSHLIRYIIYDKVVCKEEYDYVIAFTLSVHDYDYIPEKFIYTTCDDSKIEKIFKFQKSHPGMRLLIICDDFLGLITNLHNSAKWNQLLSQHRHVKTSIIFSAQYIKNMSPILRTIATHFAIFKCLNIDSLKSLYNTTAITPKFDQFQEIITNLVKYEFIWIDKNSDNKYNKQKAPKEIPKYKLKY